MGGRELYLISVGNVWVHCLLASQRRLIKEYLSRMTENILLVGCGFWFDYSLIHLVDEPKCLLASGSNRMEISLRY